ncbi:MBL fold metallo-hydrolase [Paenibacillus endoradicis]|uniref:MBL fold metallo-hydrolase n=1 Tax=Paenibacillus endoradicis TaxID=2972487 RepID=UPI002159489F|nr:MBL fold metallo-hydrolase [Paenibacillus endoradicis]MCR8657161.1 MBL fold metallo-hydrolase [Paenibacillus endoradicis]
MVVNKWTAADIAKKVLAREPLFIIDVRNKDAYADWKIEGHQFQHLNVPYFELLDGVDEILPELPTDIPLLVVCAKEGSSVMIAEMLDEAGVEAAYLEGGMKSWSSHIEPLQVGELSNGGAIYQFIRLGKGCLSYMIISDGAAAVIDAVRFTDVFEQFASSQGATITHVLDTHLHADHISGGRALAEKSGSQYYLPPLDASEVNFAYKPLIDGMQLQLGSTAMKIQAHYSPGHTIGSTSFTVDDRYLLSGDILFVDSIGRPDLAGEAEDWAGDLRNTLYDIYRQWSEPLIVLPAHYMGIEEMNDNGTVAKSLEMLMSDNHGLNIENEEEFRSLVTKDLPSQPNSYIQIREVNMGKRCCSHEEETEMEIGPNRCAVR